MGWSIWNFQSYQRNANSMQKLQGFIKNEVEFPGAIKKKSCGISRGLGFLIFNFLSNLIALWNFQRVKHNFVEFLVVELYFVRNF